MFTRTVSVSSTFPGYTYACMVHQTKTIAKLTEFYKMEFLLSFMHIPVRYSAMHVLGFRTFPGAPNVRFIYAKS